MLLKVANPYDPTAERNPMGTGIGLQTVRHIIKNLGGHVFEPDVVSEVFEVRVLLPLAGDD
jgi:signal transduction histidine kinase